MMKLMRTLLPLGAAFALSGCLNFGSEPPEELMMLTPDSSIASATSRTAPSSEAVTVVEPNARRELATLRVPVRSRGTAVAYLKDAHWVEMPAVQFGRLLAETIGATTGRVVLDPKQFSFDPGIRLTGQLQEFGLDADAMEVVAIYDAALARDGGRIETRRFEARVPVAEADKTLVAPALNQAANRVAADVAAWIGG